MKKFVYIFTFIIGLTFTSFAQNKQADVQQKLVKLYPIPATSVVNFDLQRGYDKLYSLEVYNFMGKKVYELKNFQNRLTLPLTDFFRGLYYYHLIDRTKRLVEIGRFQVIK